MKFYVKNNYTQAVGDVGELILVKSVTGFEYSYFTRDKFSKHPTKKTERVDYLDSRFNLFPSGLAHRAIKVLLNHGYDVEVFDKRERPEGTTFNFKMTLPDLPVSNADYSYQDDAVEQAIAKGRGLLHYPTGSGKTVIMARIIERLQRRALIIVPNIQLLHQTYDSFVKFFGSLEVGMYGDGIKTGLGFPICIAIENSLYAYYKRDRAEFKEIFGRFEVMLIDECHHVAVGSPWKKNKEGTWTKNAEELSNTWRAVAAELSAYYRFGMSATLNTEDSPNNQIVLESVTGGIISSVSVSELIDRNVLCPADVTMIKLDQPKYPVWNTTYSYDTHESGTRKKDSKGSLIKKVKELGARNENILGNDVRNKLIATIAKKLHKEGKRVLIQVDLVKTHGKILHDLLPRSIFLHGEVSTKDRKKGLSKVTQYRKILIGTIFKEGFDMPSIDALIIAGGGKSEKMLIQKVGRVLRIHANKSRAIVYDFYDADGSMCEKHSKARKKVYEAEGRYTVRMITPDEYTKEGTTLPKKKRATKKSENVLCERALQ